MLRNRHLKYKLVVSLFLISFTLLPACFGPARGTAFRQTETSKPTVNSTIVFEIYAGNYVSRVQYPYEMLILRSDGLVYYETGSHARFQRNIRMRQGQISAEQVAKLRKLVTDCPTEIKSRFGDGQNSYGGPYFFLFSPGREIWQYEERDMRIAANCDPFTQNISGFTDLPDGARMLWAELQNVLNSTVPTDVHPDLWPDKYFDSRNFMQLPEPQRPV